jgi:hypothetical protein
MLDPKVGDPTLGELSSRAPKASNRLLTGS